MQNRLCGVVVFCSPYLEKSVCKYCVLLLVIACFIVLSNSAIDCVIDYVVFLYLFV